MRTKNFALIAVALVVLIACIAAPVTAYTQLSNFTSTYAGSNTNSIELISCYNLTAFTSSVTKLDVVTTGYSYGNAPLSGSIPVSYWSGRINSGVYPGSGTKYGTGTLTWNIGWNGNYSAPMTYSYTFVPTGTYTGGPTNIYVESLDGTKTIKYEIAGGNAFVDIYLGSAYPASQMFNAAIGATASISQGSYTTYGGYPDIIASFTATPGSGIAPLSVAFNDTSTATGISGWLWNFGDGYTAATRNATHVYTGTGNFSASLSIKDVFNRTASASEAITVTSSALYWIPVTISDAMTGNFIPNSSLSSEEYGTTAAHTWTGSYGSYNVTGKGSNGLTTINYGDYIYLMGSAPGYSENDIKYHVTIQGKDMFAKNIPLCPNYITPISGESTMILDVYNNVTGAPLIGAYVTAGDSNSWRTGYTDSRGVFIYSNISSSRSLTVTATASGYQAGTLTYYAPTGGVNYVSLGLDPGITVTNYWPVTVVDATTGNAIANSELDVKEDLSGAAWYNRTSSDGKFNVTGVGANATTPLVDNMDVYLYGQASGYAPYGYIIMMSSSNNKNLQQVALSPSSISPISGQFAATYQVYDKTSTIPISGASISQYCSGLTKIGTTNSAGVFITQNNTVGTCSYTAAKSGYTTVTGSFSGASGGTPTVAVPMSATSVNPTVTATTIPTATTTVNPTATGAEGAQNAIDLLGSYAYTFMVLGIFSVFMWLFWSVLYNMTGGNIITKILKRGRR